MSFCWAFRTAASGLVSLRRQAVGVAMCGVLNLDEGTDSGDHPQDSPGKGVDLWSGGTCGRISARGTSGCLDASFLSWPALASSTGRGRPDQVSRRLGYRAEAEAGSGRCAISRTARRHARARVWISKNADFRPKDGNREARQEDQNEEEVRTSLSAAGPHARS